MALVVALSLVGLAYLRGDDEADQAAPPASPAPEVPDDPGEGCGEAAATDVADLGVGRTIARCEAGFPEADPLPQATTLRVALTERVEAQAPVLAAEALGEFEAENLDVELVDLGAAEAYAELAAGRVDVVVGGVDAPFLDAVHEGSGARLVLGGQVARAPSDLDAPQTGLWLRADLINDDGKWKNVEGSTVLVPGGLGSSAVYPIDTILDQNELGANAVDVVAATPAAAAARLMSAEVGAAWVPEPYVSAVAGDEALRMVATLPGGDAIDGTVFSPALLDADRATGLAYVRAIVRTINTHLADGYGDEALAAVAEALDVPEHEIADGPEPLFDWEVRSETTSRIQDALVTVGGVRYERPMGERALVDRSLVAEVVGADS
jgi:NitT/TauT family transport system substrate-binding protein